MEEMPEVVTVAATRADGGTEHGSVRWVADFDAMVEDDAIGVVGDLGLVAELDGSTEASLGDGTGARPCSSRGARTGSGARRRA